MQVELRTLDGLVKDRTQCAPNGYYFIPVYDKVCLKMIYILLLRGYVAIGDPISYYFVYLLKCYIGITELTP